jgi:DNA-binding transcriptional LysR family regulator
MELGSREAIKGAVEANLGVAIMSASTVAKELQLGTLVAVPLSPRLTRQLSMVYAPRKFRSKLLDAFISFVEVKFQQCGLEATPVKRAVKGRAR